MTSFYGKASTSQSWYSRAELSNLAQELDPDLHAAKVATIFAENSNHTQAEPTNGRAQPPVASVDAGLRDSVHVAGIVESRAGNSAVPARTAVAFEQEEKTDGGSQPSFYGRGPKGAPTRLHFRAPRTARTEVVPDACTGGGAMKDGEDGRGPLLAGDSVSVAPRRPAGRSASSRALDKEIASCSSPDAVLAIAGGKDVYVDAVNMANMIYAIAHLKKHGRADIINDGRGDGLLPEGDQNVARTAASSVIGLRANPNWLRVCKDLRSGLAELTARDTSNILWSLAVLDVREKEALFGEAADALRTKLATCDPVSVSKAAWALTAVPGRDRRLELFTSLAVPLVLRAEVFPLGALTMTCYAFAKAAHMDPEVYSAAAAALDRFPDEDLRPIDVCNVVWAFCTVGYRDDNLFDKLCEAHLSKRDVVINFNPQDLSNTTWGFCKVQYVNKPALDTLAWGGIQQRERFKAIHFSNFFYSFAMLRMRGPEGFLESMADLAVKRISSFDSGNLTIAVWAFAQLEQRHALIDEALRILLQPSVCSGLASRTLSMLFLAFFRFGRIADVDAVFDTARACGNQIGASGFSALLMTGEQWPDQQRLARLQQGFADEANDDRMRAAIGNASAICLAKKGCTEEAVRLLHELRGQGRWTAASASLLRRLERLTGASCSSGDEIIREIWQKPVRSGIHPIAATRQNEGPHAYTREFMTLQAVLCGAPAGDVDACMAAVEQFAESRSLWLKITAWEKAVVVHEVAKLSRAKVVVEIGGYVGYSAMNIARAVRQHGGRVASVEVDPVHVCLVRNMVEYAGLGDHVDCWTGYCYDVFPHLLDIYGPRSIGMVFMDQKGTRFHTDLARMEELDLLAEGAVILADNVLKPGAPLYIWHLEHGPYSHCNAISVREFLLQSEDWMVMAFRDPSRGPVAPVPPQLHRLAFESDAFRKRSMFDSVSPSKSDWWAFSQRFVDGLERCGTKPKIVGLHGRDNPVIQAADIEAIFRDAGRLPPPL